MNVIEAIKQCTPITAESFRHFCQILTAADKMYHFEDPPHEVINISTDARVFTDEEADALAAYIAAAYNVLDDPMEIALNVVQGDDNGND